MLLQLAPLDTKAQGSDDDTHLELVEQTVWAKSPEALQDQCERIDPIRACTRLSGFLIPGPCTAESARWRVSSPRIRVVAVRILLGPSRESFDDGTVMHENHHVIDFRELLTAYLQELRNRSFASPSQCRAAADAELAGFTAGMTKFAAASNRKRHRKPQSE